MFLGLRTAAYHVSDIEKAKNWYSSVLGFAPYFDQPFYVGFNVGGYELGLQPTEGDATNKVDQADGAVPYWGVADAAAALAMLLEKGATLHEDLQDVGEGIKVAAVKDPFGNVLGVIENPHFKLAQTKNMSIGIIKVNHVNVTVPPALEAAAKDFYANVLGLEEIPKPAGTRQNMGAWYDLGGPQLHLSVEDGVQNERSDRHVCYQVADIAVAKSQFETVAVAIIPDPRPPKGYSRFFVRDPGGNLIEITQKTE